MQDEMRINAERERRLTGREYPKLVWLVGGVCMMVNSKEEEDEVDRRTDAQIRLIFGSILVGLAAFVIAILWEAFK